MASSRVKTKRLRESATEPDTRKRIAARKLLRSKRQGGSTCFPLVYVFTSAFWMITRAYLAKIIPFFARDGIGSLETHQVLDLHRRINAVILLRRAALQVGVHADKIDARLRFVPWFELSVWPYFIRITQGRKYPADALGPFLRPLFTRPLVPNLIARFQADMLTPVSPKQHLIAENIIYRFRMV